MDTKVIKRCADKDPKYFITKPGDSSTAVEAWTSLPGMECAKAHVAYMAALEARALVMAMGFPYWDANRQSSKSKKALCTTGAHCALHSPFLLFSPGNASGRHGLT